MLISKEGCILSVMPTMSSVVKTTSDSVSQVDGTSSRQNWNSNFRSAVLYARVAGSQLSEVEFRRQLAGGS
jgi:hypothetical protein